MNHSTILQNSFLECPVTNDSDYDAQRHFSGTAGFGMDDEDGHRRVGGLGHLAQPASIPPATNGLRYSTQPPAMQDVPFATSPHVLMSPADSCSEPFSPSSGSLYSHSHSPVLPYDRMAEFRSHRVPPLQPPAGMSPAMQSQATSGSGILGRGDSCPGAYTLHRGGFPPLSGLSDMSRISPYTSTPRALESSIDRPPSMMFGQSGNILMEPVQRLSQPMTDAPPFYETESPKSLVLLSGSISHGQPIKPDIQAKIHKGFFQVDDKWTCYRRNYFSVSCSFSLHPWTNAPLFLKYTDQPGGERIRGFSMSISAIVNSQFSEVRELVQHTPKRDKQSERKPGKVLLQPSQPPPLMLGHGPATNGNHGFPLASQSGGMSMDYTSSYNSPHQPTQPPTQHTFERIQFQKATANNGKRRAQQQYYNLVVELYADIAPVGSNEHRWEKIATRLSHPMVVRGRSPGHYKDGRRDSSTSMGPDGGSGGSGDGSGGGAVLPPGIGHALRPHLGLMSYEASQRGGTHYGRPDYHQMGTSDHSSLSGSPHVSSSSSSGFDIIMGDSMDPMDAIKCTSSMGSYGDSSFSMASVEHRKSDGPFRHHLPPFDYDTLSRGSEDSAHSFPESFDSMVSMIPNDHNEPSPFLKNPRMMSHHQSSGSGFDPIYSARASDPSSCGRFESIQHTHGLVA